MGGRFPSPATLFSYQPFTTFPFSYKMLPGCLLLLRILASVFIMEKLRIHPLKFATLLGIVLAEFIIYFTLIK